MEMSPQVGIPEEKEEEREEKEAAPPTAEEPVANDWFSFLSANEDILALFDHVPCGELSTAVTPDENWGDFLPRGQVLQLTEGDLKIDYRTPLGSGAFCSVYPVYLKHPHTKEFTMGPVALKKVKMNIAKDSKASHYAVEDLRQEAKILTGLGHPNVIDLYGVSNEQLVETTKTFLVMDILKDTLESKLEVWAKTRGMFQKTTPASTVTIRLREVVFGIAEGMEYLHSKRVLFRDLKPDNIGFSKKNDVKIFDFGLAIKLREGQKCKGRTGTILYMAPEVGSPQGYDFPADVYSFGILLWQTLTAKIPFEAELASTTEDPAKLIKESRPSLKYIENKQIQALLEQCWAANPDDRPTFTEIRKRVYELSLDEDNTEEEGKMPESTVPFLTRVMATILPSSSLSIARIQFAYQSDHTGEPPEIASDRPVYQSKHTGERPEISPDQTSLQSQRTGELPAISPDQPAASVPAIETATANEE